MPYSVRSNVESVYGVNNVFKWADLDSDENAGSITARITRAIVVADDMIDNVLRVAHYTIPIANAAGTVPVTIVELSAVMAGLWLYEARGSQDFDQDTGVPFHRLAWRERWAKETLKQIERQEFKLDAV